MRLLPNFERPDIYPVLKRLGKQGKVFYHKNEHGTRVYHWVGSEEELNDHRTKAEMWLNSGGFKPLNWQEKVFRDALEIEAKRDPDVLEQPVQTLVQICNEHEQSAITYMAARLILKQRGYGVT